MRRTNDARGPALSLLVVLAMLMAAAPLAAAPSMPQTPGLGDPGKLTSLSIETGRTHDGAFHLAGRDSAQQLLVTGNYATGQVRDLTRGVSYAASPDGVVHVSESGYVTPVAEGEATIAVREPGGQETSIRAVVTNIAQDVRVNFPNEVVPVFTKFGCNSGGCHGKSGGQNGFALSLLGFEPTEDFEHLVKEGRGRRLFPAAPERSLLVQKATGMLPHGGGERFEVGSSSYRLLKRWIEQGMPYGKPDDPHVVRIEVLPPERLMERGGSQQIVVVAHYSDGSARDVTRTAQFDSNDSSLAEVSESGLVRAGDLTGTGVIMTRYQGMAEIFRGTLPLGAPVEKLPPTKNFVDELVYQQLKKLGLPPSEACDDATYLRRATIDIAGRVPTAEETAEFLADSEPNKREKLVDRLLASGDYADYFAGKWSAVLRNRRATSRDDNRPTFAFHKWIRESLDQNKPYDQFVREILSATGKEIENGPVAWYRQVKDQPQQVEDSAQLFLGLRIQCARCHHHPFEKWSQQDYYGLSAFFSRVSIKTPPRPKDAKAKPDPMEVSHQKGAAEAKNPKTNASVKPTGLGTEPMEIPADDDPRVHLADWMARPDNPFFAHALVNRYWKHFFGRGLVDPEDDMRATNPATNPELLKALADHFVEHRFDMKDLVRTICTSQTYQLTALPNEFNQRDMQNFSRFYPRRLNAEVLLDAIDSLAGAPTKFTDMPDGTRAVQLPDNAFDSYFLSVFGRPDNTSACECERSSEASLAQSLHLLNSTEVQQKLSAPGGRAARLAKDNRPHEEKIREIYQVAYSRLPTPQEMEVTLAYVAKREKSVQAAYEDILWAIVCSKEFLFNH
jgi:hypothetical protein